MFILRKSANDLRTKSQQQSLQSHSVGKSSRNQSKNSIKWLILPEQTEKAKQQQQQRFDHFLDEFFKRQSTLISEGRVVVYKIHKEAGLGNMVRGYLTALIIGMMTNRAIVCTLIMMMIMMINSSSAKKLLLSVFHRAVPSHGLSPYVLQRISIAQHSL